MSDRPKDFDGEEKQTRALAPELDNSEQNDEDTQAQSFTDDALVRDTNAFGLSDTEKVPGGDPELSDAQDLVDHMNQMVTSGRIDMSAFRGEPNMDEEQGSYGRGADEDDPVTSEAQEFDPSEDESGLPEGEFARGELSLDEVDDDELATEDDDLGEE